MNTQHIHAEVGLDEVVYLPAEGELPGCYLYPASPLEYLSAELAQEICLHWDHLEANELAWIEFTLRVTAGESGWYGGALSDLGLLAKIKHIQEIRS